MTAIARAGTLTAVVGAANLVFGVATGVIVARGLGPGGRGHLGLVMFWPQLIAALGTLSLPAALTFHIAKEGEERAWNSAAASIGAGLALASVGVALLIVTHGISDLPGQYRLVAVAYIAGSIPANLATQLMASADQGMKRFGILNHFRLYPQGGYFLGISTLSVFGVLTVSGAALSSFAGTALYGIVRGSLLLRAGSFAQTSWDRVVRLVKTGASLHAANVLSVIGRQLDRAYVLVAFSPEEIGLYFASVMFVQAPLNVINLSIGIVSFPYLAEASHQRRREILTQLIQAAMFLAAVAALIEAALAPVLVPGLLGEAYRPAIPLLLLQCVALVPFTLHIVALASMRGVELWRARTVSELITVIVFIAVSIVAAPHLGILSLPVAQGLATAAGASSSLISLARHGYLEGWRWWGIGPSGLATALEFLRRLRQKPKR